MKKLISLSIITILTACGSNENPTGEDLKAISSDCKCSEIDYRRDAFGEKLKNSPVYNLKTKDPFTGTCEELHGDGSRKQIRQYLDGKLNGFIASWDEAGTMRQKLEYKNNIQDGEQLVWNEEGVLIKKIIYEDDKTIDYEFELSSDGKQIENYYFKGDKKEGKEYGDFQIEYKSYKNGYVVKYYHPGKSLDEHFVSKAIEELTEMKIDKIKIVEIYIHDSINSERTPTEAENLEPILKELLLSKYSAVFEG